MPDKDGYRTPRDKFPIYCNVCTLKIEPAKYHDSECVQESELYLVIGCQAGTDKIPVNIYAHRDCL